MEDKQIEFGFIKADTLYRNVVGNDNGLELRSSIETEEQLEQAIAYHKIAFDKLNSKFEALIEQVNSTENKGSFLVKLQNLKADLLAHKGLGDYAALEPHISNQENLINDLIKSNRARNTDIKKALMLELDEVLNNNDLYEVGVAIKDLKQRWIKTGRASDDIYKEIEEEFVTKIQRFYDKRQAFYDDKKKLQTAKVEKYQSILDQIKSINNQPKIVSEIDEIKTLQSKWKALNSIPEKDYKPLNKAYWDECKLFFDKVKKERKESNSLSKEALAKNLEEKKKLILQMELLDEKALFKQVNKEFNDLKNNWKSIGNTDKKLASPLYDAYFELNNVINEKQFIFNLVGKKFKSFSSDDHEKKIFLLKKLTRDLLSRDKTDLAAFRENMDNMHVNKGSFMDMLESKLKHHERKVDMKVKILKELK